MLQVWHLPRLHTQAVTLWRHLMQHPVHAPVVLSFPHIGQCGHMKPYVFPHVLQKHVHRTPFESQEEQKWPHKPYGPFLHWGHVPHWHKYEFCLQIGHFGQGAGAHPVSTSAPQFAQLWLIQPAFPQPGQFFAILWPGLSGSPESRLLTVYQLSCVSVERVLLSWEDSSCDALGVCFRLAFALGRCLTSSSVSNELCSMNWYNDTGFCFPWVSTELPCWSVSDVRDVKYFLTSKSGPRKPQPGFSSGCADWELPGASTPLACEGGSLLGLVSCRPFPSSDLSTLWTKSQFLYLYLACSVMRNITSQLY